MNKPLACDYDTDTLVWLDTQIALLRARAADETGLPRSAFPASNPYTVEQLLDTEFLP